MEDEGGAEGNTEDREVTILRTVPSINIPRAEGPPKSFYITTRALEKYGHTPGCVGCDYKKNGGVQRAHNRECRDRIWKEMNSDPDEEGAVDKEQKRQDRHFEKAVRKEMDETTKEEEPRK